jgi:L-lactate dehydrogenase complex protein LldF
VYRAVGGHAYGSTYPGPIGKLVSPLLGGLERYAELPQASSLCGACVEACPVQIDIPRLLVRMRSRENVEGITSARKPALGGLMRLAFRALRSPALYRLGQWALRFVLPGGGDGWAQVGTHLAAGRDVPRPAARPFRRVWREELADEP